MSQTARPQVKFTQLFIDGEFVNAKSGKTFETIDPATEAVIAKVQEADAADVDLAVAAANRAMKRKSAWRTMDASERGRLLSKLADAVERDTQYIAALDAMDCGKTVASAVGDVKFAIQELRYFAGWADKQHGKTIPVDGKFFAFTRVEPVGVVGAITPWNYPFHLAMLKLAPALTCGNAIVLKPAEQTPLSALYLAALVQEVGFPKGVVNVVPGFGETAGAALTSHTKVNAITFTGSTEVGRLVMKAAAVNIKRVKVELGGKSPLIIFDDCDFEKAAELAHEACMVNHGQCCCAGTRTFVQAGIYDRMVKRLAELAEARKVGDQFVQETVQGPQVSKEQMETVLGYIESGRKEGARLVTGGARVGEKGYFVQPTVFADVTDDMRIAREEIFGPVQSVLKFETMDEVIERANATEYGLAAGVLTQDMDKAMVVSQALEAGTVWINTFLAFFVNGPFGGYKQSGKGREFGENGLEFFTEVKMCSMPLSEKN